MTARRWLRKRVLQPHHPMSDSSSPPPADTDSHGPSSQPPAASGNTTKWLTGLALLASLATAGVVWQKNRTEAAKQARRQLAGQAWANTQACLVGVPLDNDETLTQRLRSIRLAGDAAASAGWPSNCARHVTELYGAIDFSGVSADLKRALAEKFGCDKRCEVRDVVREMQGLEALVKDAELPLVAATVAPILRVKTKLLGKDAFPALTKGRRRMQDRLVTADGTTYLLLSDVGQGLHLCQLQLAAGWMCASIKNELAPASVRLLRIGDDVYLRGRLADGGKKAVLDRAGEAVPLARGVHTGFALRRSESDYQLSWVNNGKVQHQRRFGAPAGAAALHIVGKSLLWVEKKNDTNMLMARRLHENKQLFDEATPLGPIAAHGELSRLCRDGKRYAALFGPARAPRAMAFYDGQRWLPPVNVGAQLDATAAVASTHTAAPSAQPATVAPTVHSASPAAAVSAAKVSAARSRLGNFGMLGVLGAGSASATEQSAATAAAEAGWGAPLPSKASRMWAPVRRRRGRSLPRLPQVTFVCGPSDGIMTWRQPGAAQTIMQLRCTPQGCTSKRARLTNLAVKAWWIAASIGEKVVVVWRTEQGDLRMRLAPIEQLNDAADVLIMDSAEHGGPDTRDLQAVVGRDGVAFLFGHHDLHGLRIDADGKVLPLSPRP